MITRFARAYSLTRQLEEQGLVSVEWPPENYMVSPHLDGDTRRVAELALSDYALMCSVMERFMHYATIAAKVLSVIAVIEMAGRLA